MILTVRSVGKPNTSGMIIQRGFPLACYYKTCNNVVRDVFITPFIAVNYNYAVL